MLYLPARDVLLKQGREADAQQLQQAMEQANAGNYQNAQAALSGLLASEEVQKLLKEMEGQFRG